MTKAVKDSGTLMTVVAAALIAPDGRVLMQQRPIGKEHGGLWEFPGGKVDAGETPEAALIRELAEELGIAVAQDDLTPAGFVSMPAGARHLLLLLFRCWRWKATPVPVAANALVWDHPAALARLPMPPADRPLVDGLISVATAPSPHEASTPQGTTSTA